MKPFIPSLVMQYMQTVNAIEEDLLQSSGSRIIFIRSDFSQRRWGGHLLHFATNMLPLSTCFLHFSLCFIGVSMKPFIPSLVMQYMQTVNAREKV